MELITTRADGLIERIIPAIPDFKAISKVNEKLVAKWLKERDLDPTTHELFRAKRWQQWAYLTLPGEEPLRLYIWDGEVRFQMANVEFFHRTQVRSMSDEEEYEYGIKRRPEKPRAERKPTTKYDVIISKYLR